MEDSFSTGQERGDGCRMIQVHCVYYALYFYCYRISSTSDHQALDPGGWGPPLWTTGLLERAPGNGESAKSSHSTLQALLEACREVLNRQPCYIQIIAPVCRKGHRGSEKLCLGWGSTGSEWTGYDLSQDLSNLTTHTLSSLCSPLTHLYQLQSLNPEQRQETFLSYYT